MPCTHPRKGFFRKPFTTTAGKSYCHFAELCLDCRANVRGPNIWVARAQIVALGYDPDSLPEVPAPAAQPGLFDALPGG